MDEIRSSFASDGACFAFVGGLGATTLGVAAVVASVTVSIALALMPLIAVGVAGILVAIAGVIIMVLSFSYGKNKESGNNKDQKDSNTATETTKSTSTEYTSQKSDAEMQKEEQRAADFTGQSSQLTDEKDGKKSLEKENGSEEKKGPISGENNSSIINKEDINVYHDRETPSLKSGENQVGSSTEGEIDLIKCGLHSFNGTGEFLDAIGKCKKLPHQTIVSLLLSPYASYVKASMIVFGMEHHTAEALVVLSEIMQVLPEKDFLTILEQENSAKCSLVMIALRSTADSVQTGMLEIINKLRESSSFLKIFTHQENSQQNLVMFALKQCAPEVQNGILKTLKEKLSKEDCAIVMKQQDESGNNLVAFNVSNGDSGLKTDIMEILQGLHLDDYAEIMSQKNNFGRNLAMLVFQKNCKEMEEKTVESLEILQKSRRKVFMEILTHKDDNNERLIDFLWTHKSDNVKSAILKLYNSNNIPIVE